MRGADRRKVRIERALRSRQTDAERKPWFVVRDRRLSGFKFVRQDSFATAIGPFIVDFVCRDKRLVVEVDGGQHADSAEHAARDAFLAGEGYRVTRFRNNDVLSNRDGVLTVILEALLQD
jgi:very-short-patch-repair endonuclease